MTSRPPDPPDDDALPPLELEAIYATLPIGLCVLDRELRFVRINRRLAEINGATVEQHLGRTVDEVLPELGPAYAAHLRGILETGEGLYDFEVTGETPAEPGVTRYWKEHWQPIHDAAGAVVGINVAAEDVTDRKRAEQRQSLLQEITTALAAAITPRDVIDIVLKQGLAVMEASYGSVAVVSEEGGGLEIFASQERQGPISEILRRPTFTLPSPTAECAQTGRPVWVASATERLARYPDLNHTEAWESDTQAIAAVPLMSHGEVIGVLTFGYLAPQSFSENEQNFIQTLARQCALGFERAALLAQAREHAKNAERQRLARDLHDGVSQALVAATMMAEAAQRVWAKDPARALDIMGQVVKLNRGAQAELRTLLWELRPEALLKSKPVELLDQLAQVVEGRGLHAEVTFEGEGAALPENVQVAFYRIAQESLHNVVKHSEARQVQIHFRQTTDTIWLRIADNGRGFQLDQTSAGLGLKSMRERAEAIGAALSITSQPGEGTISELSWSMVAAAR